MRYVVEIKTPSGWQKVGADDTVEGAKLDAMNWVSDYRMIDLERNLCAELEVTPRLCRLIGKWQGVR